MQALRQRLELGGLLSCGVVSVSVLADSESLEDAFGTAFVVLGVKEASRRVPSLRRHSEIGVLFVLEGEDGCCGVVGVAWAR